MSTVAAIKFLVGGYTSAITALSFQPPSNGAAASISYLTQTYAGTSPSWLALHPTNSSILYANNEGSAGKVISFVVNKATGGLTQAGTISSGGADPAHLLALKNGNEVYVTNYSGGNGLAINLGSDLKSFASSDPVNTFTGSGPSPRQTSPHPHQVLEYNNELLVPDLGADRVWRLTKAATGNWVISGNIATAAGSGPRHAVTLSNNLYTLHELSNTLTQHIIPPAGTTTPATLVKTLPVIPPGASNTTLGAGELLLSPSNSAYPTQYLYATNRNDPNSLGDAIAIFAVSPSLSLVKHVRTGLKHIRGAAIGGPNGKYLFAAGKDGGGIVVYERTNGGADLVELARTYSVSNPTSFVFL